MNIPPEVIDKLWQAINRPDKIEADGWFLRDGLLCRTIYWTLPDAQGEGGSYSYSKPIDNP